MNDVVLDQAWNSFKTFMDQVPPHELPAHLRTFRVPEDLIDALVARHNAETTRIIELKEPLGIGRETQPHWYVGPQSGDKNWPAFEFGLHKKLDEKSVRQLDEATSKVVAMLDHPATKRFSSKGLVVGHVQSGKTSNFTGVIAKAADRGYRLFIVLSGIHNSLRRQTQVRLAQDVIQLNPPLWHQLTKKNQDFQPDENPAAMLAVRGQYLLLVVKKNAAVLRKLTDWLALAQEQLANLPTLVIDDEADQATVATKKINPLIHDMLSQLPRVCYVGYTATPFGNLLIDPTDTTDFYPRDFILSLPRSENYQGPETLFGRDPLDGEDAADVPTGYDMIRDIPVDELPDLRPEKKADIADFAPEVVGSLRTAVLWFWLATAARQIRGGKRKHSSMLIHSHSDTRVHDSYEQPLKNFRQKASGLISSGDGTFLGELERLWAEESARVKAEEFSRAPVEWSEIRLILATVVRETKIVRDHYRSTDRLDYDAGPVTVIAVGGNTLSRGLTLEGLVVSVFARSSNTYDTLLQMGRWFGYRPGYEDLPRVWMPATIRQWFTHLASVEAELRREIDRYLVEHKTPLELAVKIRCHPDMRVTAPSKMTGAVRAAAAYGGELIETRYFPGEIEVDSSAFHSRNREAALNLLRASIDEGHEDSGVPDGRRLYRGVPTRAILDFVSNYRFHERSIEYSPELVAAYIRKRMSGGVMKTWNVGVVGNAGTETGVQLPDGETIGCVNRSRTKRTANDAVADIKTLTGSRDSGLDLDLSHVDDAVNRVKINRIRTIQQQDTGLLLLYPINGRSSAGAKSDRADLNAPVDVVWGAAFVFPKPASGDDAIVEYDYVQADLSKVFPAAAEDSDDVDIDVLDEDLDSTDSDSSNG